MAFYLLPGGDIQKFLYSPLQQFFQIVQVCSCHYTIRIAVELETDHPAELSFLNWSHYCAADVLIGHLIGICPYFSIGFKVGKTVQIILARIGHKGQAVVKDGAGAIIWPV